LDSFSIRYAISYTARIDAAISSIDFAIAYACNVLDSPKSSLRLGDVDAVFDGEAGWHYGSTFAYDAIVLDVVLPKLDGITLCKQLRDRGYQLPILLLTARDSSTERKNSMAKKSLQIRDRVVIKRQDLQQLFDVLRQQDYELVGPTAREGAIAYDTISSVEDLPIGWTDEQDGGTFRLKRRDDRALFGYAVGPHSWKKYLFPPRLRLWQAERQGREIEMIPAIPEVGKRAFIGVRSCELHAIAIQDKVFLEGEAVDPHYQARRRNIFIVAVNCSQAGGTCFCASMQTGPKATTGFDLALTEILAEEHHFFVVEVGSEAGAEVVGDVPHTIATQEQMQTAERIVAQTAKHMGRTMDTEGIKELLYGNLEHSRWDDVASRCLTCANCTMVCPTCFCSTVEDTTDLTGDRADRWRRWDSCFTMDFSYIHGGSVRSSAKSRYRQWMTHKLATWIDQFGSSGCVGCGRCITWCPVAIDITEEVRAIRESRSPT
jgi:CheY-like chemotaxis protein/formate hydrogenlyase subunit 6/NADH:ubiquinone oxidoreductase subunit I